MSFSENLKIARKNARITQEQLAENVGVSRQAISKWESGESYPETSKLSSIAEVLNISLDSLMSDEDNKVCSKTNKISNEDEVTKTVVVNGKIFITDCNGRQLMSFDRFGIDCILGTNSQKEVLVIGGDTTKAKVPTCILYGVVKSILGINKKITLGFYREKEDAQKELSEILTAVSKGESTYKLKFSVAMNGVRIADEQ